MLEKLMRKESKGFTLVEMAIVLVIIGIILAAVMKGRDLISSGEETRQEQSYFQKWLTITNDYYKAVKKPLGDSERFGGEIGNPVADGYADVVYTNTAAERSQIMNATNTVGMDPCLLIKSNINDYDDTTASGYTCPNGLNPFQTMLDTEFSGKVRTYPGWVNAILNVNDASGAPGEYRRKNLLVFYNVPVSYAKRLDSTVDGVVDGSAGKCLYININPLNVTENILTNDIDQGLAAARTTVIGNSFETGGGAVKTIIPTTWPTTASDRDILVTIALVLDY